MKKEEREKAEKYLQMFKNSILIEDWGLALIRMNNIIKDIDTSFTNNDIEELVNIMERWHLGRSEDAEVIDLLNDKLFRIGKLQFFNKEII